MEENKEDLKSSQIQNNTDKKDINFFLIFISNLLYLYVMKL